MNEDRKFGLIMLAMLLSFGMFMVLWIGGLTLLADSQENHHREHMAAIKVCRQANHIAQCMAAEAKR